MSTLPAAAAKQPTRPAAHQELPMPKLLMSREWNLSKEIFDSSECLFLYVFHSCYQRREKCPNRFAFNDFCFGFHPITPPITPRPREGREKDPCREMGCGFAWVDYTDYESFGAAELIGSIGKPRPSCSTAAQFAQQTTATLARLGTNMHVKRINV